MSGWDALFIIGTKVVVDLLTNNNDNNDNNDKSLKEKATDIYKKTIKDISKDVDNITTKAKEIQQKEMINKSVEELRRIAKSNAPSYRIMAANLELKARGRMPISS